MRKLGLRNTVQERERKRRERQRENQESLTQSIEHQKFMNDPSTLHDTQFLMIGDSQYSLLTYQ